MYVAVRVRPLSASHRALPLSSTTNQNHSGQDNNDDNDDDTTTAMTPWYGCVRVHRTTRTIECRVMDSSDTRVRTGGGAGRRSKRHTRDRHDKDDDDNDAAGHTKPQRTVRCPCDVLFDATSTQDDVMAAVGRRAVEHVLCGYNSTLLCYGQSGSGKTYTMVGPHGGSSTNDNNGSSSACFDSARIAAMAAHAPTSREAHDAAGELGLLLRVLHLLLHRLHEQQQQQQQQQQPHAAASASGSAMQWRVRLSALELYNKHMRDLLPSSLSSTTTTTQSRSTAAAAHARRASPAPVPSSTARATAATSDDNNDDSSSNSSAHSDRNDDDVSSSSACHTPRVATPSPQPASPAADAAIVDTPHSHATTASTPGRATPRAVTAATRAGAAVRRRRPQQQQPSASLSRARMVHTPVPLRLCASATPARCARRGNTHNNGNNVGGSSSCTVDKSDAATTAAATTATSSSGSSSSGVRVHGLCKYDVDSFAQAAQLVRRALQARKMAHTQLNDHSNRAHTLFFVEVEQRTASTTTQTTTSSTASASSTSATPVRVRSALLTFADLAGSERASRSGAAGARLQEACNINSSLLALHKLVRTLAVSQQQQSPSSLSLPVSTSARDNSNNGDANTTTSLSRPHHAQHARSTTAAGGHVPYRDDKLTMLLRNSFGGNAITWVLYNVSPDVVNAHETASTLRFALDVRRIRNVAVVNEATEVTAAQYAKLLARCQAQQRENAQLRSLLAALEHTQTHHATPAVTSDAHAATLSLSSQQQQQQLLCVCDVSAACTTSVDSELHSVWLSVATQPSDNHSSCSMGTASYGSGVSSQYTSNNNNSNSMRNGGRSDRGRRPHRQHRSSPHHHHQRERDDDDDDDKKYAYTARHHRDNDDDDTTTATVAATRALSLCPHASVAASHFADATHVADGRGGDGGGGGVTSSLWAPWRRLRERLQLAMTVVADDVA